MTFDWMNTPRMNPTRFVSTSLAFTLIGFVSLHAQVQKPALGGVVGQVTVVGQVKMPGVVQFRESSTILAMVNDSGGPTASASMKRVRVIRGGAQRIFDLTDVKITDTMAKRDDKIEIPQKNILERIADAVTR
jgi:SLBB domain